MAPIGYEHILTPQALNFVIPVPGRREPPARWTGGDLGKL